EAILTMPPAYTLTLGVQAQVGSVAAVRAGSPAERMGVLENDILKEVHLRWTHDGKEGMTGFVLDSRPNNPKSTAPIKLPSEVEDCAYRHDGVEVSLVVVRHDKETNQDKAKKELPWVKWDYDDKWRFNQEMPLAPSSPTSIPALGLAYRVKAEVAA